MSILDTVKKFTRPYADDDYDDDVYEDEEGEGEFEEPAPERSTRRRRPAFGFSTRDTSGDEPAEAPAASTASEATASTGYTASTSSSFSGHVVGRSTGPKLALHHISAYKDCSIPADDLRNRKAVIVNMENVDKATARRIVDFLSGCIYAIEGKVRKVSQATYLFSPSTIDVEGDLENLVPEGEGYI